MKAEELTKLCVFCHGAFGYEPKPQTIRVWSEILCEESFAPLEAAARRIVANGQGTKPPSPAELLRERDGGNGASRTPTPSGVTTSDFDFHQIVRHRIDSGLMPILTELPNGKNSLGFTPYMPALHEKCTVRLRGRVYPALKRRPWEYETGECK